MLRKIVKWCDDTMEKAYEDESKFAYVKAMGVGAVEGLVDAAIICCSIDAAVAVGKFVIKTIKK